VGGKEVSALAGMEPALKYHPEISGVLTLFRKPDQRQCMVGSLTGAVSSQRVTEEHEGTLSAVGNRAMRARAKGCLTERPTGRSGAKAGSSDPVVLNGRAIAQRIKGTPGITG
jgi:hypothetical protein